LVPKREAKVNGKGFSCHKVMVILLQNCSEMISLFVNRDFFKCKSGFVSFTWEIELLTHPTTWMHMQKSSYNFFFFPFEEGTNEQIYCEEGKEQAAPLNGSLSRRSLSTFSMVLSPSCFNESFCAQLLW
jgi:hypothetical protein